MARNEYDTLSDVSSSDMIDSRDLIDRLDELEELAEAAKEEGGEPLSEDDAELLKALTELRDECDGMGWKHGIGFIRDTYFKDYAEELADDIGAIDKNASWPNTCIDWDRAARELQMDYTSTEINGVTFWYREA